MSDVQIAIGLGWKPGMYPALVLICPEVFMDNFPDKIMCRYRIVGGHIVP
jgi:hypothetical protein